MNEPRHDIEKLRNKVVNLALIAFASLAVLSDILAFKRALEYDLWSAFVIQTIAIALLVFTTIFRNKISLNLKIYSLSFVVLISLASGLNNFGFLGSAKVLIAILSVFISFVVSYRKALFSLFLFSLVYVIFAFLYSTGKIVYSYDLYTYATSAKTWIHDYVIIFLTSWGLLYVGYHFSKALTENYLKIENQNIELTNKEEKYRTLFESSNDAIIMICNKQFYDCNSQTLNLFQCGKDNFIGKEPHEFSPEFQPDGINSEQKSNDLILKAFRGKPQIFDWQHKKPNGELFDVSVSLNLIEIDKIKYIQAVLRDITEKKEAEKKLMDSEERYKKLVDAFPDLISISDPNYNIIFANKHFETITGITKEEYTNPNRKADIHPEDRPIAASIMAGLLNSDKIHSEIFEARFIDTSGEIHWISGTISKIYINGQLYFQSVGRDITAKKQIEEELEKHWNNLEKLVRERTNDLETAIEEVKATNEELYSKNEIINDQNSELKTTMERLKDTQSHLIQADKMASLGVLTAGVSHEINNPLNYIMGGYIGLENYFNENGQNNNETIPILLNSIKTGIDRAAGIVKGLNQFTRSSDTYLEDCDIHSIINNCLVMLNNQFEDRIEINKRYSNETIRIKGNASKLHQVFLNVLLNSSQAIDKKGIVSIITNRQEENIIIELSDTGCGIGMENIAKISDPFFTTKDPGKGIGLGLSIAYSIIKDHKGKIEFLSEINKGTTVKITLSTLTMN